ncbi:MAG: SgcJ/EcaC family oxidoreductase [Chitinophagaceae bacterium]|nr:SgcJ/EcaC family oxidoreductase [Chitinophagaceae bacterium]
MLRKLSILLLVVTVIGCDRIHNRETVSSSEGEILMQRSRDWSKAASSGNNDSILSYWTDDAVVMAPGQVAHSGKKEIRQMVEGMSKIPGFQISWEPKSVVVSKSGDLAYMIEENQVTMNDSTGLAVTERNKAVTIWRKDADGVWRCVVDTWNSNSQ